MGHLGQKSVKCPRQSRVVQAIQDPMLSCQSLPLPASLCDLWMWLSLSELHLPCVRHRAATG